MVQKNGADQNNISRQKYVHRGYQDLNFYYDNLDRLTQADYLIFSPMQYEAFGMDDLGNRTTVHPRVGSNVSYTTDPYTNRYTQVGASYPLYDDAGNMIRDEKGYEYDYDYENRIVKVWKNSRATQVAEYVYDALGRRIRKIDNLASANSRWYYYNDKWQITAAYDDSGNATKWIYGNYIDEALVMIDPSGTKYYYGHDQL